MNNDEYIYIFLHIPKCAGSTFERHLICNFPYRSILLISRQPNRKLLSRVEVDDYIKSLPRERKDCVRVVCGHSVYYGIHEHFGRQPRYFTFLRNPITRTLSQYNFVKQYYEMFVGEGGEPFPKSKDELTFEKWWSKSQKNPQVGVVLNFRIGDKPGWDPELRLDESHLEEAKRILDRYYFVGLTENFDEDSLFLYNELHVSRFLKKRQNVTKSCFLEVNEKFVESIRTEVTLDSELYKHAAKLSCQFKTNHPNFREIVERIGADRKYVIPVRFVILETIQSILGRRRTFRLLERTLKTFKPIIRLMQ